MLAFMPEMRYNVDMNQQAYRYANLPLILSDFPRNSRTFAFASPSVHRHPTFLKGVGA
jgi:hypothetical protein